jgi:CRISPR/Cas system-associated exonuclease Cas4 (RecB family)
MQTCFARWDFGYGGHLAGDALKPLSQPPILSDGRAWGAAVAAYYASASVLAPWEAHEAMHASYAADIAEMLAAGLSVDPAQDQEQRQRLGDILDHHIQTVEPLPGLTRLEHEFDVPVPSRGGGQRGSNLYRFRCFIDGYTTDHAGREWLVEIKLRKSLQSVSLVEKARQYRWYAWAARKAGHDPIGIIVDERLNEPPGEPRILKSGRVSADTRQHTTEDRYAMACAERGQEVEPSMLAALRQIRWHQRVPILFRSGELDEAGRELTSAARVIRDLDSGLLYPMRNASRANCGYCRFRDICSEPTDALYIDTLFSRVAPKRLRESENGTTTEAPAAPSNPFEAFA